MKTKSKIPALRFKGFTDAWEERKLIEVADYRNGKAHEKYISEAGDYIVVNSKFVSTNGLVKKYSDEMIAPLSKNEIAFVLSDVPNGRAIARTFLISEENKYSLNQRIAGITPHADTNSYFLHSLMNRNHYFLRFDDGVSQTNLSKKEVEKWVELYPSYGEQQRIGSFFKQLDDTIALHQRKCDQTKELKKTMLQKMFPKKGERIPEIRFPEFTDEWEEKKLGEVVEREIKGKAKANMQGTKSIYLETEYLNGGETTFVDSDADIEEDDILILWDGSQAGTVYHGFFGALGSTLKAYRPKESGKFVYYQLVAHQEMIFQRYRTPNIPHVIKTFTDEFSVFTTSLSEQERIGNFFKHLDTLIALHQSKCDSLKELKKTLLRQLFV